MILQHFSWRSCRHHNNWWIELFLRNSWLMRDVKPFFQPTPQSEVLTIENPWHAANNIWTCTEPAFRLCWIKFGNSDKDNLRQDNCLACSQIRKRKRKSGAYEVASRAEREDEHVISTEGMTCNESSDNL